VFAWGAKTTCRVWKGGDWTKKFEKRCSTLLKLVCRAGPSRCGAQCKTYARGPFEQWFYDVIVFNQPCYNCGRAQICSTAL